jgi:hypothetical protein
MRSLATAEVTVERGWKAIAEVHSAQRVKLAIALRLTQTEIENTRSLAADLQLRAGAAEHYDNPGQHVSSVTEFFDISSVISADIGDGVAKIRAQLSHALGAAEREAEAEQDNINETDLVAITEKSRPSQQSTAYIYVLVPSRGVL